MRLFPSIYLPRNVIIRFGKLIHRLRKLYFAIGLVLSIIVVGVIGFMWIADHSFVEAFYMTIITVSTTGYGEVGDLGTAGRMFAAFLIITNIGIFTYAISLISSFIVEGEFRKLIKEYNTLKTIDSLKNHVIVCGLGRYGRQTVMELHKMNQDFVAIEVNLENIKSLKMANALVLEGDATNDDILLEAGILKAKAIIITISHEAENVLAVISARQLNPKIHIISRSTNDSVEKKLLRAGANHVVMPEKIGGFYMASLVQKPESVEFFNILSNLEGGKINFEEIACANLKTDYKNKTFKDLDIRSEININIIAIHHPDGTYQINPKADTILSDTITLVILGEKVEITKFKEHFLR